MIIYYRARKEKVQITKKKPLSEDFNLLISLQRKARYQQINNNNNNKRKQKK